VARAVGALGRGERRRARARVVAALGLRARELHRRAQRVGPRRERGLEVGHV
jgi:hypothetical protein